MRLRLITALLLAPAAILLTLFLPTHWLSVILLVVALMGLYEWNRLTVQSVALFLLATPGLAIATWWLVYQPRLLFSICVLASLLWLYQIYVLQRFARIKAVASTANLKLDSRCSSGRNSGRNSVPAFSLGAFCLLGVWAALVLLHQQTEHGAMATVALLVMVWAADCFAYFTGKALGRNKLAPALSPNKTVEGVIGGLLGVCLVAGLFGLFVLDFSSKHLAMWMVAGLSTAVFSVVGDLYESRLKRLAGVKDSGHLLPGHGGILDRIDGLIAAAPVFVTLVLIQPVFTPLAKWLP